MSASNDNLIVPAPDPQSLDMGRRAIQYGRRIVFALVAGWSGRGMRVVINLVQLPLLLAYLTGKEAGLWVLVASSDAWVGLLDFGLGYTLTRRIAYAVGKGSDAASAAEIPAEFASDVGKVLGVARYVYSRMSAVILAGTLLLGYVYLASLDLGKDEARKLILPWIIVCIGHAINVRTGYGIAVLNGLGEIGWPSIIRTIWSTLGIAASWAVLARGFGMTGLACVWLIQCFAIRMTAWVLVYRRCRWLRDVPSQWDGVSFRSMIPPSLKWWAAITGTFFAFQFSLYVLAYMDAPDMVVKLTAIFRLIDIPLAAAISLLSAGLPLLAQMWSRGDLASIRRFVIVGVHVGLGISVSALVLLNVYGEELFRVWIGSSQYPGFTVILVMSIMTVLNTHHGILLSVCVATEDMEFYKWQLACGGMSIVLVPIACSKWGLQGIAVSMMLCWMLTNNWYIPYVAVRKLEWNMIPYLRQVTVRVLLHGLVTLGGALALKAAGAPFYLAPVALIPTALAAGYEFWRGILSARPVGGLAASPEPEGLS